MWYPYNVTNSKKHLFTKQQPTLYKYKMNYANAEHASCSERVAL